MNRKWSSRVFAVAILFSVVVALPTIQRQFSTPVSFSAIDGAAAALHVTAEMIPLARSGASRRL